MSFVLCNIWNRYATADLIEIAIKTGTSDKCVCSKNDKTKPVMAAVMTGTPKPSVAHLVKLTIRGLGISSSDHLADHAEGSWTANCLGSIKIVVRVLCVGIDADRV